VTEPFDTEKGVPDGFFLTSYVHKIHFRSGLCPGSRWFLKVLEFDFAKQARTLLSADGMK